MAKNKQPPYLMLARILRPHGIRGDMRVQIVTSFPERLTALDQIWIGPEQDAPLASRKSMTAYRVVKANHDKGDNYLIHLDGIDTRDAAEPFRTLCLYVPLEQAAPLAPGEFYMFQLIGLEVATVEGKQLGTLQSILETGANDVFIVKGETYGEVLIPVIDGVIISIDLTAQQLVVQLPDGLMDAEEA